MILEVIGSIFLRYVIKLTTIGKWLEDRVEINTPATSWKRIEEGISLRRLGLDPYSGDIVHEAPLIILFYENILPLSPYLFLIVDVLTAWIIKASIDKLHKKMVEAESIEKCHPAFNKLKISLNEQIGYYGFIIYLFNPYSVVLSVTQSTQCVTNLLYSVVVWGAACGSVVPAACAAALAAYSSLFPVILLVPLFMQSKRVALLGTLSFGAVFGMLHYASYLVSGSWSYLSSVYGFILLVPDYTPNIGAAWYFFSEMFSHFTVLFLSVYQLNLILYAVPLSLKFPDDPPLVIFSLLMVLAMFKPYTSVGDYTVPFAMLPIWAHLSKYLQQSYIVAIATVVLTLLWPVLWYLWTHCLNANSNFYFAITLAFVLFQSFLLSDIIFAKMRRDYAREHGVESKKVDEVETVVTLN